MFSTSLFSKLFLLLVFFHYIFYFLCSVLMVFVVCFKNIFLGYVFFVVCSCIFTLFNTRSCSYIVVAFFAALLIFT